MSDGITLTEEQLDLYICSSKFQQNMVGFYIQSDCSKEQAYQKAKKVELESGRARNGKLPGDIKISAAGAFYAKNVKAFIKSVQGKIIKDTILTRQEALERLTTLARANLGELMTYKTIQIKDRKGNIHHQMVFNMPDSGETSLQKLSWISEIQCKYGHAKIKLHDPLKAIDQIGKMEGWDSAQKVINLTKPYEEMTDEELDSKIKNMQTSLEQPNPLLH